MKKMLAWMLTLAMIASMTTVSFAATRTGEKNDTKDHENNDGTVTVDTEAADVEVGDLVPGTKYTFEINLHGGTIEQFDETKYTVTAEAMNSAAFRSAVPTDWVWQKKPTNASSVVSNVDIIKGDKHQYLTFTTKDGNKKPGEYNTFGIKISVTEKGDKDTYEVTSKSELSSLQSEFDATDDLDKAKVGDIINRKYTNVIMFTVTYPDIETIDDDEWEVDNKNPLVNASNDVGKCTLLFGSTAEYEAKFSSKEKKYNLGYSFAANSTIEKANPSAELTFVTFTGNPSFASSSDLIIYADDPKYMYEIGTNDKLTKLNADFDDESATYRTQTLTSYVVSDRALKGASGSSSSSSSSSSSNSSNKTNDDIIVGDSAIESMFGKWFTNDLVVLDLNGESGRVSVECDLTELNTNTLRFYNYNKDRNSYSQIKSPAYSVSGDTVTFTATSDGYVLITDGPFTSGSKPSTSTGSGTSSGVTVGDRTVEKLFDTYFSNDIVVLHLGGKSGKVTVECDLSDLNTNSLRFYSYDKSRNSYSQITSPAYSVSGDKVTFTSNTGGYVIITDRAFSAK